MICHSYPRKLTLSPAIITCSNLVSARCGERITENKVFLKKNSDVSPMPPHRNNGIPLFWKLARGTSYREEKGRKREKIKKERTRKSQPGIRKNNYCRQATATNKKGRTY